MVIHLSFIVSKLSMKLKETLTRHFAKVKSLTALRERLLDFIDYFNCTFAKPFRWTYTGRPITAETSKRPTTWKEIWASCRENSKTLALVG